MEDKQNEGAEEGLIDPCRHSDVRSHLHTLSMTCRPAACLAPHKASRGRNHVRPDLGSKPTCLSSIGVV